MQASRQYNEGNRKFTVVSGSAMQAQPAQVRDEKGLAVLTSEHRCDRESVLAAAKENLSSLENASHKFPSDREFLLAVVKRNFWALEHAPHELRSDRDFMLAAVSENVLALEYASHELLSDREFMLAALKNAPLKYASDDLRSDCDFMLAAVKRNVSSVNYVSHELRKNHEVHACCCETERPRTRVRSRRNSIGSRYYDCCCAARQRGVAVR